jgi:hypothetical protein
MRPIRGLVLVLLLSFTAHALADESRKAKDIDAEAIRHQADLMGKAMLTEDFKTLTDFTFPKLVEILGGPDRMIERLKAGMEQMKKSGYAFKSYDVQVPKQIVDSGSDIIAIVPQIIVMTVPTGTLTQKGYLIAVSSDQGGHWTFLDSAAVDDEKLKVLLPKFPPELKLPPREKPVIESTKK